MNRAHRAEGRSRRGGRTIGGADAGGASEAATAALQSQLRDETEKALAVLNTIADSVITIDAKGTINSFNDAAVREFGYAAEEAIGQNVKMLMTAGVAQGHDGFIRNYLETGESKIIGIGRELTALRKDGTTFDIELAIGEMTVGGERMFTGVVRNITERKHAAAELTQSVRDLETSNARLIALQQEIKDSERKAVTVLETIADSVITIDARGVVQSFNLAAEREFGFAASEVIGQNVRILMPADMAGQHDGFLRSYLRTGESRIIGIGRELKARRKDGSVFDIELAIGEMEVGGERMFTGVIRNISQRKRAEAELLQFLRELRQSNEELERFASVASHDLQEPLRKVRAFGDRLKNRYSDVLGETGRDYIARMLSSTVRMQMLIDNLLSFSRIATKPRAYSRVNLNEIVAGVLADLETSIAENGARIETDELPVIEADPLEMRQLFQNLIGNAIKYRKPSVAPEVRVFVGAEPDRASETGLSDGPYCRIGVADNGIGFEPEYAERIFEIFQRLHGRDEYQGTGVGLAICRKIVDRHGGRLEGIGAKDKGATFIATLPLSQGQGGNFHELEERSGDDPGC